jgi:hypothetical protein
MTPALVACGLQKALPDNINAVAQYLPVLARRLVTFPEDESLDMPDAQLYVHVCHLLKWLEVVSKASPDITKAETFAGTIPTSP